MIKLCKNNLKIDIFCAVFLIFFLFILGDNTIAGLIEWKVYFSTDRLGRIASFFSIVIGIYIAVMTILASSITGLTEKVLEKKLDDKLLSVIMLGLCENLLSVSICVFMPITTFFCKLLVLFTILALISLIKFIYILALIFKINLNEMARMIDVETKYKNDLLTNLEQILDNCENKGK